MGAAIGYANTNAYSDANANADADADAHTDSDTNADTGRVPPGWPGLASAKRPILQRV